MPIGGADSDVNVSGRAIDLSVVILTGGVNRQILHDCIRSVTTECTAAKLQYEVIVIDNACSPELGTAFLESFPEVVLLRFSERVGFPTGNNAGFKRTCGRYILQLNDDTRIEPGAFRTLIAFMDQHPEVGASGPRLLNPDGSLQVGYTNAFPRMIDMFCILFGVYRFSRRNRFARRYFLMDEDAQSLREVDQPAGAALLYRRGVLNRVGLPDENYTYAYDDVDMCMRIKAAGYKIYYVPQASITHYGGMSILSQPMGERFDQVFSGVLFLYQKHRPGQLLLLKVMMIAALCVRLPWVVFKNIVASPAERHKRRGQVRTYWKYLVLLTRNLFSRLPSRVVSAKPTELLHDPQYRFHEQIT
jgi:GT2 family glycosyltransferase